MSRLRVVHAAKYFPPVPGGMETVIGDLCHGTAHEWDVRAVAAHDRAETVHERVGEVTVTRAARHGVAASVPLCPTYPLHLWQQRADCVVLHEPNPIAGASVFLRTPAPRLIIWHHSDLLRPAWAPHTYGAIVQRSLYRRADCVVVSSPNLAASSALVRQARRVAVVPFGIDLERFQRPDDGVERRAAAMRAGLPGPVALFVGRFVYYKGLDVLVEALRQCDGSLLLAGEGPLESELRRQVAAHGLESRVRFLGRVPDAELPACYRAADYFVLPSVAHTETFGVVQVEAMASGLPVISTRLNTGVPWVNQDGISGLTVEPGRADALAQAMRILAGSGETRERLARGAAARAQSQFSRPRMLALFRDVVEQVVSRPAPVRALARAEWS